MRNAVGSALGRDDGSALCDGNEVHEVLKIAAASGKLFCVVDTKPRGHDLHARLDVGLVLVPVVKGAAGKAGPDAPRAPGAAKVGRVRVGQNQRPRPRVVAQLQPRHVQPLARRSLELDGHNQPSPRLGHPRKGRALHILNLALKDPSQFLLAVVWVSEASEASEAWEV